MKEKPMQISFSEVKIIKFTIDGERTCAAATGRRTCPFLRYERCGTIEICAYDYSTLNRRGEDQCGTLIPSKTCPLWGKNENV